MEQQQKLFHAIFQKVCVLMPQINCYIPIKLRIVGELSEAQLEQLGQTLVRTLQERLAFAERTIAARHNLASLSGGAEVREAYDPAREEAGVSRYRIPSYQQSGQPVSMALEVPGHKQTTRPWIVRQSISFRIQLSRLIDWFGSLDNQSKTFVTENRARYFDLLTTVRPATAWLVVTNRPMYAEVLAAAVQERFANFVPGDRDFIFGYSVLEAARLRLISAEESNHLHALPEMRVNPSTVTADGRTVLYRNGMMLFVAMMLPQVDLPHLAVFPPEITIPLSLRDLDFIVNDASFERLFHFAWRDYIAELGNQSASLHVQTVTPLSQVHFNTLHALVESKIGERVPETAAYSGNLYLLNQPTLDWTPPPVRTRLDSITDDSTRALDEQHRFGHWEAGWAGAFIYAVLSPTPEERAIARHRPAARRLTPPLLVWLQGDSTDYDWPRGLLHFLQNNFGSNPPETRPDDGTDFEFVLIELENQGHFNTLFEKVEAAHHNGLHQLLMRLTLATSYAANDRVRRSLELLGNRILNLRRNVYHIQPQELFLDRAISGRVQVGQALGDVDSIYIFEHEDKRLKPARIPAFREALKTEREELIKRILKGQDTKQYTEEEFLRTAMAAAVQRIHLSDDDFEKVTIQRSIRLLRVEARTVEALPRFFVTFEFVERVKGEGWQSVSKPIPEIDDEFEARLIYWQLGRAGEFYEKVGMAITIVGVIVIAWEAGLIAALVEAAGGATAVLVSISISELIYVIRVVFGNAELSLRGFLEAALDGYLMALGFRGAGFLGRAAARAIGTEPLKRIFGGWVAERLIVGVVGGAGTAALTTFSHDLINVATGEGGWSGFRTYVRNMALGAAVGIVIEFVGMPILKSLGRTALESLTDARELARLIRAEGISAVRWTSLITEGLSNVHARLSVIIGDVAAQGFVKAMGERLTQVAEELGARFVSRRVLELAEASLTRAANNGLEKLLGAAEFNPSRALRLFNSLADNPQQAIAFLEVLNGLEEAAVRRLLEGTFGGSALEMARFLARISRYSLDQQRTIVRLLLELGIEAGPPRAGAGRQSLLQRQFATSLRIQAGGVAQEAARLQQQAATLRRQAATTEAWNPDRAARLREQADGLDRDAAALRSRSEGLHREAEQVSGGQGPTPQLPGPTDVEQMFGQARSETWIRIRLDEIERNPEAIERLVRPIFRSRSGNRVVFRVEGGTSIHARSQELINIDEASGQVRLTRATLNMNFGVFERAIEFILEHRPGARLKVFEVDEAWLQSLRSGSIPERGLPADPSLPKLQDIQGQPRTVDIRFGEDQLQIPFNLVDEFQKFVIPNSGRVVEIGQ